MKRALKVMVAAALIGLATGAVNQARANIDVAPTPTVVSNGSGGWTWTYSVSLASNFNLQAGDEFVIYDFTNLIAGSAFANPTPIGPWSVTEDPGLTTPPPGVGTLTIPDDPTRPNLVFVYQGTGFTNNTGVDVFLGLFGADSATNITGTGGYAFADHKNTPASAASGQSSILVPMGVPEPASLLLVGLGAASLFGYNWRRRRQAMQA